MSSTNAYDDSIEVISTRGGAAAARLNDDSGYSGSSMHGHQHVMERYCEFGAETQLCTGSYVQAADLGSHFANNPNNNNIPPRRFILQSDEEIIRHCYANGSRSFSRNNNDSSNKSSFQAPTSSGTETCLIVPSRDKKKKKTKKGLGGGEEEEQTPDERRVARMIVVVAGVLLLASFVLVGVTLSMSAHIDEMVKKMHTTTPYPVKISRTTVLYVNITNS